jgi:hypothetical protein
MQHRGLTINEDKYQLLATSDEAREMIPGEYASRQSFIVTIDPVKEHETKAYSIEICNVPIGDAPFVASCLQTKFQQKCNEIKKSSNALSSADRHASFQALLFSFQARFDYWYSAIPQDITRLHDGPIQACLNGILKDICGYDPLSPPADGTYPNFVGDRIALKCKNGGLGIRPMTGRASLLNALNCSLPQMIDQVGVNGDVTPGLWDSLSSVLGAGSFDHLNKATCWQAFHTSGSIFASGHLNEIATVKTRYASTLDALGEQPPQVSIFNTPDACFGYDTRKLHKKLMDELRSNEARLLKKRAEEMPRDDPRAEAFLNTWKCPFANRFPLAISSELHFTSGEFYYCTMP